MKHLICLIWWHFPTQIPDQSFRDGWVWINTGAREIWIYGPSLSTWILAEPLTPGSWVDLTADCSQKNGTVINMLSFFKNSEKKSASSILMIHGFVTMSGIQIQEDVALFLPKKYPSRPWGCNSQRSYWGTSLQPNLHPICARGDHSKRQKKKKSEIERDSTPPCLSSTAQDATLKCHYFNLRLICKGLSDPCQGTGCPPRSLKPSMSNHIYLQVWDPTTQRQWKLPSIARQIWLCNMFPEVQELSQISAVNLREQFFNCSVVFHCRKEKF